MTAKTILALAQAHRKEPSRANYAALAAAIRKMEAERDTAVAEVARLTPLQYRAAPCHKFCEANAFQIEIRQLRADAELWRAYKARKDAALAAGFGRSPLRADHEIGGAA